MTDSERLLGTLLKTSEKAANIARVCRQNEALFQLLIQEKSEEEKNPRFFHDFKTLADVLIQETIKHDIGLEFPQLAKRVRGEETNVFSNTLGTTVTVEVKPTQTETENLLAEILDNNTTTAEVLAKEIHREIDISEIPVDTGIDDLIFNIDVEDLAIWVDPIDATADYISGNNVVDETTNLHTSGLRCVTVLIGAYSRSSGDPILGVINQPFYTCEDSQWKGHCYWGYYNNEISQFSFSKPERVTNTILVSRCEDPTIRSKLEDKGYRLMEVSGVGYKILSVATGLADAYILSKGSTFKWDTCGPQALLNSVGGSIFDFNKYTYATSDLDLKYHLKEENHANRGGLFAFNNLFTLFRISSIGFP
ncbi:inositol polyphosphate 1-phosphatase [Fopius arisanus]|uniref:Inositol polyphosphate 1-phosphatase n=2 Tax=Fopius arisanus TaxID=64838 RepID=A0A9R1UAM9_9HYME|nr:PREDICTED: inositol polyphosphate 1-phosphatase [Fopius arisanus]XP_011313677.1 PREDICTED: inositol polyphosphate 1-phosphatase [Fopius arisanus]